MRTNRGSGPGDLSKDQEGRDTEELGERVRRDPSSDQLAPQAACMFCGKDAVNVTREITQNGLAFVVYCPCDGWEVPGAKSPEQALKWWRFGDKKGTR